MFIYNQNNLKRRTAYSRVQLRIQFSADYPSECPIVELSSPSLPQPLLRNKEKECMDKAKTYLNQSQAKIIFEHISSFIYNNMFIPCNIFLILIIYIIILFKLCVLIYI